MSRTDLKEFDFEPVPGLPENLPEGERLLWRGSPEWQALARRPFHVRLVAIYFAALVAWNISTSLRDGAGLIEAIYAERWLVLGGLAVTSIALGLAMWVARSTIYTITDRRLVMRFGLALPMAINLPFSKIDGAAVRVNADGTGDIPVTLGAAQKEIAYVLFWPHVRLWRMRRTEPALRGVADAHSVAGILGQALAASAGQKLAGDTASIRAVRRPASADPLATGAAQPAI